MPIRRRSCRIGRCLRIVRLAKPGMSVLDVVPNSLTMAAFQYLFLSQVLVPPHKRDPILRNRH